MLPGSRITNLRRMRRRFIDMPDTSVRWVPLQDQPPSDCRAGRSRSDSGTLWKV